MSQSPFAIGAVVLLLLPQAAGAQVAAPSSSVTDLQKLLKPGEVLVVIDDKGERTTGAFKDLSSSTLTLQVPGKTSRFLVSDVPVPPEQRQFAFGAVTRIDRRDSTKEGAWLGLAAGLGFAFFVTNLCGDAGNCPVTGVLALGALIGGPVIGALVDQSITTPIYRAPTGRWTASLGLSPRLQEQGGGVSVRFAF